MDPLRADYEVALGCVFGEASSQLLQLPTAQVVRALCADVATVLWEGVEAEEKLDVLLRYLRGRYSYCLYCGCGYEGALDLERSCPGLGEDCH